MIQHHPARVRRLSDVLPRSLHWARSCPIELLGLHLGQVSRSLLDAGRTATGLKQACHGPRDAHRGSE